MTSVINYWPRIVVGIYLILLTSSPVYAVRPTIIKAGHSLPSGIRIPASLHKPAASILKYTDAAILRGGEYTALIPLHEKGLGFGFLARNTDGIKTTPKIVSLMDSVVGDCAERFISQSNGHLNYRDLNYAFDNMKDAEGVSENVIPSVLNPKKTNLITALKQGDVSDADYNAILNLLWFRKQYYHGNLPPPFVVAFKTERRVVKMLDRIVYDLVLRPVDADWWRSVPPVEVSKYASPLSVSLLQHHEGFDVYHLALAGQVYILTIFERSKRSIEEEFRALVNSTKQGAKDVTEHFFAKIPPLHEPEEAWMVTTNMLPKYQKRFRQH